MRPVASALVLCSLLLVAAACGSSSTEDGAAAAPADDPALTSTPSRPFVLVPIGSAEPAVARSCAGELGATYCTATDAAAAARRCDARLAPATTRACPGGSCSLVYAADRTTCHAGATYGAAPGAATTCDRPLFDDCSFYRSCLEATHPCGEDGYALVYGERLCYAFVERRAEFSTAGQRWLREIRSCLQRSLVPLLREPATCTAVLDGAYATHPGCYTAPGNSICDLPTSDVLVLAGVLGSDLFSARALAQMEQVAHTCLLRFLGFDTSETNGPRIRFFAALEEASRSEETLRAFVATP